MSEFTLLWTVAIVHLLATMSPGPGFIMMTHNSLTYSRKIGIFTAIGFGAGIVVHILYSVLGLSIIISRSIFLFNIIKWIAATYLLYIGVKSLFLKSEKPNTKPIKIKKRISSFQAFKTGFLTNILNPKTTLFFLGLFSFVITPGTPSYILVLAAIIMTANTILWFSLVAVFITHPAITSIYDKFQAATNRIFGALLIAFGIKIALSEK